MRCKTAWAVDFIHGDAPDSLQREEKRETLRKNPAEKEKKLKKMQLVLRLNGFSLRVRE